MQTEDIFENIAKRIIEEIQTAKKSIFIAVAWFTNRSIYEQIILKAKQSCKVQIIISNDEINENSSVDFENKNANFVHNVTNL
ncbi:hypothetical protein OC66_06500 [Flavobacterium psychrophilum]|uniref:phospholipase D-like domain-containing protein n=1 Tax=Flavobacterium psychrophilum TaxID=96345 RepID=UPI000A35E737|nr:phospholipase D-like domain-containing protein [Flavobacterium psychrophilum]EKT4544243.1 hypothetical protein [Flavobacterium psychrophilum]OUD30967.1 hypothetical protein FPG1W08_04455 [Flavobacterium psychrophilum]ROO21878.1 hypothetical protein OC66_06500 [Flavobacterium psychrophilum]